MTYYPTGSHYPDTEPISPCPILDYEATNINFKVFGLTRPGFKPSDSQISQYGRRVLYSFDHPDWPRKWLIILVTSGVLMQHLQPPGTVCMKPCQRSCLVVSAIPGLAVQKQYARSNVSATLVTLTCVILTLFRNRVSAIPMRIDMDGGLKTTIKKSTDRLLIVMMTIITYCQNIIMQFISMTS